MRLQEDFCSGLPLLVEAETAGADGLSSLRAAIRQSKPEIEAKLETRGAVLFRGFDVSSAEDFRSIVDEFQPELINYVEGQSERGEVLDKIYNSTYYPANEIIPLHNELSYTKTPPSRLFFFCRLRSETGGETPLLDCRQLLTELPTEVVDSFRGRGIRYVKNMHGGRGFGKSWQESFEAKDRDWVEKYLRDHEIDFEWKDAGVLCTRQVRPALALHPATGEEIWFNQASLWHISAQGDRGDTLARMLGEENLPTHCTFENGDPIPAQLLEEVRRVSWSRAAFFPWRQGDLLCLDNHLVAHGRNRFTGDRSILVAMA